MKRLHLTLRKYDNFVKPTNINLRIRFGVQIFRVRTDFGSSFWGQNSVFFDPKIEFPKTRSIFVKIISNLKKIISKII